jgi:hypothetical protein
MNTEKALERLTEVILSAFLTQNLATFSEFFSKPGQIALRT